MYNTTDTDSAVLEALEKKAGYVFRDRTLLQTAVTHSSYANEHGKKLPFNERLEFLGDSVLGMISAEYFYKNNPELSEGELTRMRAAAVCEKSLHGFAKSLDLGEYLILGKGEIHSGGNERPSILADAFEALIAAIYLDGGIDAAKKFVLGFISGADVEQGVREDYKSALQAIVQETPGELLEYYVVGESGPEHNKTFIVEVHLNSNVLATGEGRSKKLAEQAAAKEALSLMGVEL